MKNITIEFTDHGQDFLKWIVDPATNQVIESTPFQSSVWGQYTVINIEGLKHGATHVSIRKTKSRSVKTIEIKYPIEKFSYHNGMMMVHKYPTLSVKTRTKSTPFISREVGGQLRRDRK